MKILLTILAMIAFVVICLVLIFGGVALILRIAENRYAKKRAQVVERHDGQWERRNKQGRCGSCDSEFTENNPDAGGGQCRNCWASWG
ncbi:hypothetical protein AMJ47_03735 [Parcubacteria bacterium DG_72]|nr:MAG: hypothetical protein AMJ47_03735 [Parcubacteria bacterium DG_72]